MTNNFKDSCDICGKFDYLKGINGKCLCSECRKEQNEEKNKKNVKKEAKQLNILDFIDNISHFSHKIDDIM